MEPLVNRVAESDIEVLNLEDFIEPDTLASVDIAQFLDKGFILREKDFRQQIKDYDWTSFDGQHVAVFCSTDAIVPTWAYMLIAIKLTDVAQSVLQGEPELLTKVVLRNALDAFDWTSLQDRIVVVKGCGSDLIPEDAYQYAATRLTQVAKKVMYGEPCSSVPLWRKKAAHNNAAQSGVAKAVVPPGQA